MTTELRAAAEQFHDGLLDEHYALSGDIARIRLVKDGLRNILGYYATPAEQEQLSRMQSELQAMWDRRFERCDELRAMLPEAPSS